MMFMIHMLLGLNFVVVVTLCLLLRCSVVGVPLVVVDIIFTVCHCVDVFVVVNVVVRIPCSIVVVVVTSVTNAVVVILIVVCICCIHANVFPS